MKREMPLTDRDFASIRQSVMATIERRRSQRAFAIRAAGLTLALVVVFFVAMRMTKEDDVVVAPVRHATFHKPASVGQTFLSDPPKTSQTRMSGPHHKRTTHKPEAPIRIELTTADPDVRIIWIPSSTGETR